MKSETPIPVTEAPKPSFPTLLELFGKPRADKFEVTAGQLNDRSTCAGETFIFYVYAILSLVFGEHAASGLLVYIPFMKAILTSPSCPVIQHSGKITFPNGARVGQEVRTTCKRDGETLSFHFKVGKSAVSTFTLSDLSGEHTIPEIITELEKSAFRFKGKHKQMGTLMPILLEFALDNSREEAARLDYQGYPELSTNVVHVVNAVDYHILGSPEIGEHVYYAAISHKRSEKSSQVIRVVFTAKGTVFAFFDVTVIRMIEEENGDTYKVTPKGEKI